MLASDSPLRPPAGLSIVVPVLDEAAGIAAVLQALAPLRERGHEVIVVDGGSRDDTVARCAGRADRVLQGPRGRARQMNLGAQFARGEALLFLHADTLLPERADEPVMQALSKGAEWGRFDVCIGGRPFMLRVVAWFMNRRSRLTGIATGDQALFIGRKVFHAIGGFPDQPLMEDIELCRRLLLRGYTPACLAQRVVTSGRRWEQHGVWRTIVLMWRLRWRYWRGAPADVLAKAYR
jgi:rSAM/selenodomain-associated transferase 2